MKKKNNNFLKVKIKNKEKKNLNQIFLKKKIITIHKIKNNKRIIQNNQNNQIFLIKIIAVMMICMYQQLVNQENSNKKENENKQILQIKNIINLKRIQMLFKIQQYKII